MFTPTERLHIYQEMREVITTKRDDYLLNRGFCKLLNTDAIPTFTAKRYIMSDQIVELNVLPELYRYKPVKLVQSDSGISYWFTPGDWEPRLRVLDKAILDLILS